MSTPPIALTIAGSDPSGGAGIQADLKTFHQFGVYGTSAITLVTVQNTVRVSVVEPLSPSLVAGQIRAIMEDLPLHAIKTGALGNSRVIEAVAEALAGRTDKIPLVVDPVMISKHGAPLIDAGTRRTLRDALLPYAALVTPNLHEAAELAQIPVETLDQMKEAASRIAEYGPRAVLVKGGHLAGDAIDVLYVNGTFTLFTAPRIHTQQTHGTGCTYSAAIAALLALGEDLPGAVSGAKAFITEAIRTAPGLGAGCGPVNHWAARTTTVDSL